MMRLQFQARPGMNLIEVLVAAVVAGIVMLALGGYITANLSGNAKEKDRAFAHQKAVQMLEEMSAEDLAGNQFGPDLYAKEGFSFKMTIRNVAPGATLSGNTVRGPNIYKFVRRIESTAVAGDPLSRKVSVKVWYQKPTATSAEPLGQPLAVVSGVLRTKVATIGPKQVIDVYAISIENIPHLFRNGTNQVSSSTTDARARFEAALNKISIANPGLEFRVKYISRLSVGRDIQYRPYVNEAKPLTGTGRENISWAYFYPGRISAQSTARYFDYASMKGYVTVNTTGSTMAPLPASGGYGMVDQWNHAVRYKQEFNDDGTPIYPPAIAPTATDTGWSLRQFLEMMLQDQQDRFRNAVVVNLHGEMFPVIPLRNYADAASDISDDDASGSAKRRLVTHPYKINFATGGLAGDKVRLLVHGYTSDGSDDGTYPAYARKFKVIIKDIWNDLVLDAGGNATAIDVDDITVTGIRNQSRGNSGNSEWETFIPNGSTNAIKTKVGQDVEIEFTDIDYDAKILTKGGGSNKWGIKSDDLTNYGLYRLQYFPDPFLAFLNRQQNGAWNPRNTAKYIIEFPIKASPSRDRYHVLTQLGMKQYAATTTYPLQTSRVSANSWTSFYIGKTWNAGKGFYDGIPLTDQVQIVGDPRHMPYLDGRRRGLYNKYWTNFTSTKVVYKDLTNTSSDYSKYLNGDDANSWAEWTGAEDLDSDASLVAYSCAYPNTADSWHKTKVDMPAYLSIWREALLRNNAVFVNLSGEPVRYIGMGGEFALNGSLYDYPAMISKKPWDPSSTADAGAEADEIFSDGTSFIEQDNDAWFAKPWIGELWPHTQRVTWAASGNLPYGTNSTDMKRRKLADINNWDPFANKANDLNRKKIDGNVGFPTLLNGLKSGSTTPFDMKENGNGDKGAIQTAGTKIFQALHMTLPNEVKGPFAYKLDNGATPTGWAGASSAHGTINWLLPSPGPYYKGKNSGEYTVHPIVLQGATSTDSRKAFFVVNAFRPENTADLSNIMQIGLTSMVGTYLDATRTAIGDDNNVKPQPRAKMIKPRTDETLAGNSVDLEWYARFIRTDGQQYTPFATYNPSTPTSSGGPLSTVFFVKYRNLTTNGPWTTADVTFSGGTSASVAANVDVTAEAGTITTATGVNPIPVSAITTGPPPYSKMTAQWNTSGLPNGDYLLRVEAYRKSGFIIPIHYAYHEIPVKIQR